MDVSRREFVKALAAAAVVPLASSTSPTTGWAVTRATMWNADCTAGETLTRCNRLLATNPDDVLALVHRGQIPSIYFDQEQAWADLSRAIELEPANPCCWYIRGVCFERAEDLKKAIWLLSKRDDLNGKAVCFSIPDWYEWRQGTEAGEMMYLSLRELGYAEEQGGCFSEAIDAYEKAAAFESISPHDLETWAESSFLVGTWGRAFVAFNRLIAVIGPKAELVRRRVECLAAMKRSAMPCRISSPVLSDFRENGPPSGT